MKKIICTVFGFVSYMLLYFGVSLNYIMQVRNNIVFHKRFYNFYSDILDSIELF